MKPGPDKIIVRCHDHDVEWDMDAEPAKCTDPAHVHSLNGGPPVDGEGRPKPEPGPVPPP